MDDIILQGRLVNQDNAISHLLQSQQEFMVHTDSIDARCDKYDNYIPDIDYCWEAIGAYVKKLAIKLLDIGIDYYIDCNYTIVSNNIKFDITYYVSGNTLNINVDNNQISYNDKNISIHKLLTSPGWENIILYDIRGLLNRFNTINS